MKSEVPQYAILRSLLYFLCLRSQYFPWHPAPKHPLAMFSVSVEHYFLHLCKRTGKIMVMWTCILTLLFQVAKERTKVYEQSGGQHYLNLINS